MSRERFRGACSSPRPGSVADKRGAPRTSKQSRAIGPALSAKMAMRACWDAGQSSPSGTRARTRRTMGSTSSNMEENTMRVAVKLAMTLESLLARTLLRT